MELNDHGLPKPGRELDLEVARILGYEVLPSPGPTSIYVVCEETYILEEDGKLWLMVWDKQTEWTPSTTHAFFQVMEAMEELLWEFAETASTLEAVLLRQIQMPLADVYVNWADYPDREHAYAHTVCCCAWKAMGGENA